MKFFNLDGTLLANKPNKAGNYYFEVHVKENINYFSKKFRVDYQINPLRIDVSNLSINTVWSNNKQDYAENFYQLKPENGIISGDSICLTIKYFGNKIGDTVESVNFHTSGWGDAYKNYVVVGTPKGEVVGQINIEHNGSFVSTFVKRNSNTLYSSIDCLTPLTADELKTRLSLPNDIKEITFKTIDLEDRIFATINENNIVANDTIVCNMRTCHKHTVVTDFGYIAIASSQVNSGVFAENIIISDFNVTYITILNSMVLSNLPNC
jgi:hypothetical protein